MCFKAPKSEDVQSEAPTEQTPVTVALEKVKAIARDVPDDYREQFIDELSVLTAELSLSIAEPA